MTKEKLPQNLAVFINSILIPETKKGQITQRERSRLAPGWGGPLSATSTLACTNNSHLCGGKGGRFCIEEISINITTGQSQHHLKFPHCVPKTYFLTPSGSTNRSYLLGAFMASPKAATFLASAVARCMDRPKPDCTCA
jgi:hypothetical protein